MIKIILFFIILLFILINNKYINENFKMTLDLCQHPEKDTIKYNLDVKKYNINSKVNTYYKLCKDLDINKPKDYLKLLYYSYIFSLQYTNYTNNPKYKKYKETKKNTKTLIVYFINYEEIERFVSPTYKYISSNGNVYAYIAITTEILKNKSLKNMDTYFQNYINKIEYIQYLDYRLIDISKCYFPANDNYYKNYIFKDNIIDVDYSNQNNISDNIKLLYAKYIHDRYNKPITKMHSLFCGSKTNCTDNPPLVLNPKLLKDGSPIRETTLYEFVTKIKLKLEKKKIDNIKYNVSKIYHIKSKKIEYTQASRSMASDNNSLINITNINNMINI